MTVSDQIIAVIKELANQFGIAIDWTAENVLPYVQKLCDKFIKYEIATSIIWIIFPLVLTTILLFVSKKLHKGAIETKKIGGYCIYDVDYAVTWFAIISWILLVICCLWSVIAIIVQAIDIATAITFPEKIIFDTIYGMISTTN